MKAAFHEVVEGLAVVFPEAGDVEYDALHFKLGLVFVVVKLTLVEGHQFQYDHCNGK